MSWTREDKQRRYQLRKEHGICRNCPKPIELGKATCRTCLDKYNKRAKEWHRDNYNTVLNHYGAVCVCCGETDERFLTIDHINNDGYKLRGTKQDCTGPSWYARIIKRGFPSDLQVLCFNCNLGKNRCGGICPHKVAKGQGVTL